MPSRIEPTELAELVADARALPPALLPRPRADGAGLRVIDLDRSAAAEVVTIPEVALSLVDGYAEYGA